jgi:hypothetical protein
MFRNIREPDCYAMAASREEVAEALRHARPGLKRYHPQASCCLRDTPAAAGE